MKIAHLTTVHGPFDVRIFQKQCRSLSRAGHEVVLVAPHERDETVEGVRIRALGERPRSRFTRATQTTARLVRIIAEERPDVCHFHDPELVLAGLLLKAAGHVVVYDVHENSAEKLRERGWLPSPFRSVLSLLFRGLERLSSHFFDANVCATPDLADRFPDSRTITVRNYPPSELTELPLPEKCYTPGNRTLIYTGGWTPHRGVEEIVAALAFIQIADVRLIVIGGSDESVLERARKLPGFRSVEYPGVVPHDHAVELVRASAVGLVCNQPRHGYDRALPNKLFEYMAAGLPVVASSFKHWVEIVEGNEAGLTVDPEDPRAIARAVERLLGDAELRRSMGERGRTAVRERYNWSREEKKLLHLYEGLAS